MELDKDFCLSGRGDDTLMGAIFMSNTTTMRECFRRHLFGLPGSKEGFVKKVKAGMVLFLFEYEKRKLHGVFEATSDGALNIVPHAFTSTGQPFPAQIRFKKILSCYPLAEHEFCDAIKENYYTHQKFNFCLSQEQVQELLGLFFARKIKSPHLRSFGRGKSFSAESDKHHLGKVRKDRPPYLDQKKHNSGEDVDFCGDTDFSRHSLSSSRYCGKPYLDTRGSVVGVEPMSHPSVPHDIDLPDPHFGRSISQDDDDVMGKVHVRYPDDHPYYARVSGFRRGDSSLPAQKPYLHSRGNVDIHAPSFGNQLYQSHLYRETSNLPSTNYGSLGVTARPEDLTDLSFPYHEPPSCSPPVLVPEDIKNVVDFINFQNHPSFPDHCEPPIHTIPSSKSIHSACRSQQPATPQYKKKLSQLEYSSHGCDHYSLPEDKLYFPTITGSSFSRSPKKCSDKAQYGCASEYTDADYLPHQSNLRGLQYMHNGYDVFPPPEDEYFNKKTTESFIVGSPQKRPSMRYVHNGYDIFPPPGDEHINLKTTESSLESPPKSPSTDQYGYLSESKDRGARERLGPYHSARYYENFPTVENYNHHTDTYKRGTSVFSRLSRAPEVHREEDETCVSDTDLTVNQLMEVLSKRKKYWHTVTKPLVTQEGNVSKSGITKIAGEQLKSVVLSGPGEAALKDKGVHCNEVEVAEKGKKIPFLNFKRRSKVLMFANENETTPSASLQPTCVSDADLAVNQLMEVLSKRKKYWQTVTKPMVTQEGDVSKSGITKIDDEQLNSVVLSGPGGAALEDKRVCFNDEEVAEKGRKIPFLNFKRRSKLLKFGSENETTPSVESTEYDGSLVKPKRRKLVRPSFLGVSFNRDNGEGKETQTASQELCVSQAMVGNDSAKEGVENGNVSIGKKLVRPSFLRVSFNKDNSEGKETQTASQELCGSQAIVVNDSAKEGVENGNGSIGNNNNEGDTSFYYKISASQEPLIEQTFSTASEYIGSEKLSSKPVFGQAEEAVANVNCNLSSGKAKSDGQNLQLSFEQPFGGQLLLINAEGEGGTTSSEASVMLIKNEGNENLGKTIIDCTNSDKYAVEERKDFRFGSYKTEPTAYKVLGMGKAAVMIAEDLGTVEVSCRDHVSQDEGLNFKGQECQGSSKTAFSESEVNRNNESIHNHEGGRKVDSSQVPLKTLVSLVSLECEVNFSTEVGKEDAATCAPESDKNRAKSSSQITYESEQGSRKDGLQHGRLDSPVPGKCGRQECDEVYWNAVSSETMDFIPLVATSDNIKCSARI